jgi:hypothetical protein
MAVAAPAALTGIAPNAGPTAGGNQAVISGTSLGSGSDINRVLFGSVEATIVSQSTTQVVVVVPASAEGAVSISTRSASRGEVTLAAAYTYTVGMCVSSSVEGRD